MFTLKLCLLVLKKDQHVRSINLLEFTCMACSSPRAAKGTVKINIISLSIFVKFEYFFISVSSPLRRHSQKTLLENINILRITACDGIVVFHWYMRRFVALNSENHIRLSALIICFRCFCQCESCVFSLLD